MSVWNVCSVPDAGLGAGTDWVASQEDKVLVLWLTAWEEPDKHTDYGGRRGGQGVEGRLGSRTELCCWDGKSRTWRFYVLGHSLPPLAASPSFPKGAPLPHADAVGERTPSGVRLQGRPSSLRGSGGHSGASARDPLTWRVLG